MFNQLKQRAEEVSKELEAASDTLAKYPRGAMGLTPDHIKFSPEFQKDKAEYDRLFHVLRQINGFINKHYKKELRAYNQAQREAKFAKLGGK